MIEPSSLNHQRSAANVQLAECFDGSHRLPAVDRDRRGAGALVAVIDSGWDKRVGNDRVVAGVGIDISDSGRLTLSLDDGDTHGHGSACTSIISAIAPSARVLPVRILDEKLSSSPAQLVAAIDASVDLGATIINLSLGMRRGDYARQMIVSCERAASTGAVVVAAAFNGAQWCYPAVLANVIGVAATKVKHPSDFEYDDAKAIECLAHGAFSFPRFDPMRSAASFATATISGLLAVLLSISGEQSSFGARQLLKRYSRSLSPSVRDRTAGDGPSAESDDITAIRPE